MRFIPALCGAIVFSGCGDTSLLKVSFAPNVVITSPMDESLYEEGDIVDFEERFPTIRLWSSWMYDGKAQ